MTFEVNSKVFCYSRSVLYWVDDQSCFDQSVLCHYEILCVCEVSCLYEVLHCSHFVPALVVVSAFHIINSSWTTIAIKNTIIDGGSTGP